MAYKVKIQPSSKVQSVSSEKASGKGKANGDDQTQRSPPEFPLWRWLLSSGTMLLGALLYGLDTTISASVQTAVYQHFHEIKDLAWIGLGFPMASVATILLIGRIYQLFDVQRLYCISVVLFEAGSALCGAAPTMNALIAGRVIAGIGGCGMYIGGLTFFAAFGSPKKLALYNACIGTFWGAGSIIGPIVGGLLSDSKATWRWAFYINLPLAAICAPIFLFIVPSWHPKPGVTIREKLSGFDVVGAFLYAGVIALFMTSISFAGSTFAWKSGTLIALLVVSAVVLVAFILQQGLAIFTTKKERMFPGHFLRSRTLVLLFITTSCAATATMVTLYYIPLFFGFTRGDSVLDAAKRLLPFIVLLITFVMIAGGSLPMLGRYSPQYVFGGVLMIAGSAGMSTARFDTHVALIYGYEILIGAGTGLAFQHAYAIASIVVQEEDKPNAIAFINTGQLGGAAIGLSIASCLYQNIGVHFLGNALKTYDLPRGILEAALGGVDSGVLQTLPVEAAKITTETVAFTISRLFYMNVAAGAVCLVAGLAMKHEKTDLSMFSVV